MPMGGPLQLAEFARRGQWQRCLLVLQQLVATKNAGAIKAVLQQPSVLHRVIRQTWPDSRQGQLKRVCDVLVLCGQALRTTPPSFGVASTATTIQHAGVNAGAQSSEFAQSLKSEETCCLPALSVQDSCEASAELSASPSDEWHLPVPQRREWRNLITSLLQLFTASAAAVEGAYGRQRASSPVASASTALCNATIPLTEELLMAVRDVCSWAERARLGVDSSLLSDARAKVAADLARLQTPCTREDKEIPSATTDRDNRHKSEEGAQKPNDRDAPQGETREELTCSRASASRTSRRLAAAWRRATGSQQRAAASAAPLSRTCRSEAEVRAGFREAVSQLRGKDDATASAEFALSLHRMMAQLIRRQAEERSEACRDPTLQQLLPLFHALCAEVLRALEAAAADPSLRDGTASADDELKAILESIVVVVAAEGSILGWGSHGSRPPLPERGRDGACAALTGPFGSAECALHTIRAVRCVSGAVPRLFFQPAPSTGTEASSVPPSNDPSSWLAEKLAEVRQNFDEEDDSSVVHFEVLLLRLLVDAADVLYSGSGVGGSMHSCVAALSHVDAAVPLITAATLRCGGQAQVRKVLLCQQHDVLQVPASNNYRGNTRVRAVRRRGMRGGTSAFVCRVLDNCPAQLPYALLTASLHEAKTECPSSGVLSPAELANLASALQALSMGFYSYTHPSGWSSPCATSHSSANSNRAVATTAAAAAAIPTCNRHPQIFSCGDASFGTIPFLSCVFASMSSASLVELLLRLWGSDAGPLSEPFTTLAVRRSEEAKNTQHRSCVVWRHALASIPDLETREAVAQELLHLVCKALTENLVAPNAKEVRHTPSFSSLRGPKAEMEQLVSAVGVLCESLLANPSCSPRAAAACVQSSLQALTQLANNGRLGSRESYAEHHWLGSAVRQWLMSSGFLYLHNHAQLLLESATTNGNTPLPPTPSRSQASRPAPAHAVSGGSFPNSAALQCAAWLQNQLFSRAPCAPSPSGKGRQQQQVGELMRLCGTTATQMARLCRFATYQLRSEGQTAATSLSTSSAGRYNSSDRNIQTLCTAVCDAAYNSVGVAWLCHLAVASTEAPSFSHPQVFCDAASDGTAAPSCIYALLVRKEVLTASRGPLVVLRAATPAASQEGPLNVLQLHHGRPLSGTQHEQLVCAMEAFSHKRRIREAVALFYSYERQNRRLGLSEVELFAAVAKRATPHFLVRLLTYVPPPCESAVLATAIVTGAWNGYRRAWRRYKRSSNATARNKGHGDQLNISSSSAKPSAATAEVSFLVDSRWCRRRAVEQSWYEALAITLQAMELLPTSTQEALRHSEQQSLLFTLHRLLLAQPPWLAHSDNSAPNAVDAGQLRAAILVGLCTTSPSVRHRLLQEESVRHSIGEVQQTLNFCMVHKDAETAVRAYLRFVQTHTISTNTSRSSSPRVPAESMKCIAVPLMSVDSYASLLWLSSMYVTAVEASPEGWSTMLDVNTSADGVREKMMDALTPQPQPKLTTKTSLSDADFQAQQGAEVEESDMEQLCRLRVSLEDEAERDPVLRSVEATGALDGDTDKQDSATASSGGRHAAAVASANASSVLRRAHTFQVNCAAVFRSISATLPRSLRRRVEGDMSLAPLVTVLHDALRWCRLRPRLLLSEAGTSYGSSGNYFGVNAALTDAETAEDVMRSGADVLMRILGSALHMEPSEVYAASTHSPVSLRESANGSSVTSYLWDGSVASSASYARITCRVCTCRLRHETASWNLLQHTDVLLEYVLLYLRELHTVEHSVLWISPAQQQRAKMAMVECLQVVEAVMEAVDVWAAEYAAQMVRERGSASIAAAPSALAATPVSASEETQPKTIEAFRERLRGTPLDLLNQLLFAQESVTACSMGEPTPEVHLHASSELACVLRRDLMAFEKCSPANPVMRQLCSGLSPKQPTALSGEANLGSAVHASPLQSPPQALHELMLTCTQSYFSALASFIEDVTLSDTGAAAAGPAPADGSLACRRLSFLLRCMTASSVGASDSQSGTSSGGAQALLARLAAADVILRKLSSRLMNILIAMETPTPLCFQGSSSGQRCEGAAHAGMPALLSMSQLLSVAHDFGQAVLLLDECAAWWNALHLESSVDTAAASSIAGSSPSTPAVNWSSTYHSHLDHVRLETSRLTDALMDLYATAWWSSVLPRLEQRFAACAAHFWSDEEVRFQHLYINLALLHRHERHGRTASSVEYRLGVVQTAEKLQQTLVRHPPSTLAANGQAKNQAFHLSVDIETLLDDADKEGSEGCGNARSAFDVELALLEFLVQRSSRLSPAATQSALKEYQSTSVQMELFGRVLQAALSCLPWQHAALLWRTLPFLFEDGDAHIVAGASPSPSVDSETDAGRQITNAARVRTCAGLTCTLPSRLWRLLEGVGQRPATADAAFFSEGDILSVALLSPTPLIMDGLVVHPLLRHSLTSSSAEAAMKREPWLSRLVTYGMDETEACSTQASASIGAVSDTSADRRLPMHGWAVFPASYASVTLATAITATTTKSVTSTKESAPRTLSVLIPTSLCRRVATHLVLASLRDASLTLETPPTSATPFPSKSPRSSAVSREKLLLDLVHVLGYVAPQAWRVALQWIQGTPYPTEAYSSTHVDSSSRTPNSSSRKATSSTPVETSLSPVETCTLRRLRAVFLACGPWPAEVALPLLGYVLNRQRRASNFVITDNAIDCGGDGDASALFPEAEELYLLFSSAPPRASDTSAQSCEAATAVAHHPLISPVITHYAEGSMRETIKVDRQVDPKAIIAYRACNGGHLLSNSGLHTGASRNARFHVASWSMALRPPSSILRLGAPSAGGTALSAFQLVSQASMHAACSELPPALSLLLLQLSTAPSLHACARLVRSRPWREEVLGLRRRNLPPLLQLLWKTLLMRKAELDAVANDPKGGKDQSFGGDEPRSSPGTIKNSARVISGNEPNGYRSRFTKEESAWLEVCAVFFVVTSSASARLTMMAFHSRAKAAKMRAVTDGLTVLKNEICCVWVSLLLEHALQHSFDLSAETTERTGSAATAVSVGVEAHFSTVLMNYLQADTSSPARQTERLQVHLRHACEVRARPESGSSVTAAARPRGKASQTGRIEAELAELLADAEPRMRRAAKVLMEGEAVANGTRSATEVRWLLWPPAAWEAWIALRHQIHDGGAKRSDASIPQLHNPLLVVALMQAWQCCRGSKRDQQQLASDSVSSLRVYATIISALCAKEEPTAVPNARGRDAPSPGVERWSLMQLWSCVDEYVHTGSMGLCTTSREKPDSCTAAEGTSIVIEAFLQLLSTEDARMRRGNHSEPQSQTVSSTTADLLILKAVLRCLRPQLLNDAESVPSACASPQRALSTALPWSAYLPPHRAQEDFPDLNTRDRGAHLPPASIAGPWHSYLHVLHLCTAGLLDRSAHRRGRRAAPTSAGMARVARNLHALRQRQTELRQAESAFNVAAVDSRRTPPALSLKDGQRILCWQLRQLLHIQTHVNALGWTAEQHQQYQSAQRHLQTSVLCVASLVSSNQQGSASKQKSAANLSVYNAVEAATAACFYPHLAVLRPPTADRNAAQERQARRGSESAGQSWVVGDMKEEEALTTFADPKLAATQAQHPGFPSAVTVPASSIRDEASAASLLGSVRRILHHRASSAQLQADLTVLHVYLAAVLGCVAQRRQIANPTLLLDCINGAEANRILYEMKCSQDAIVEALTRIAMQLVYLLSASPLSTATGERGAVVEAGLRLWVAFQPWLPVRVNDSSASLSQLTDASLVFALSALEAPHQSADAQEAVPVAVSNKAVAQLVACTLDDLLHRRQSETLSSRGLALLGVIHQRLAHVGDVNLYPDITRNWRGHGAAHHPIHAQKQVDREKLLWRVLHALAALREQEAAEVHHAWLSYSHRKPTSGKGERAALLPAKGSSGVSCYAEVTRGLYGDAIKTLYGNGGVAGTAMNADFFFAAVRLRTWWAADEETGRRGACTRIAAVAHVHVLEDLLCVELLHRLKRVGGVTATGSGSRGRAIHHATRRACLELYSKYTSMWKTCTKPDGFSSADDRSSAAALALQLAVAAMLLPSAQTPDGGKDKSNRTGSVSGLSDTHLAELLAAAPLLQRQLQKDLVDVSSTNGYEAPLLTLRVTSHSDIEGIAAHLLLLMSRQLLQMRTANASSLSDVSLSSLLHRWETILAPLRALRTAEALREAADKMQLAITPWGLQYRPAERSTGSRLRAARMRLPRSLTPTLYLTLRNLSHASRLPDTPLRVLLHELLLPLLVLETKATCVAASGDAERQLWNRQALLRRIAYQLAAHPAFYERNTSTANTNQEALFSPLTPAIESAARITVTACDTFDPAGEANSREHHESGPTNTTTTTTTDLCGWPAALLVLKVLVRLEALLKRRVSEHMKAMGSAALPAGSYATSVPACADHAFASRYAALLAQRGSLWEDYLAFVLVARHYASDWGEFTAPFIANDTSSTHSTAADGVGSENRSAAGTHSALSALDWAQLPLAATLVAPPHSVGALIALFRHPTTPSELWPRVRRSTEQIVEGAKAMNLDCETTQEERAVVVVIPAVTETEMQELKSLDLLLKPPS
ncbi:hypothetical protein ABL78_0238 [Leptomonas seymouri]|uniref:Uncharacterized protein n=1 Tax=Leptomonas seymouri TaxID=5684 RepID=A0A0N1IMT7_LEPSE|nr:hypothetical protein ABL78_0238 [Leptomonas seymouri]|eukprot:KPI90642.1 hypothetical protein ABL78_0238 [Leptomonas seymouri]